MPIFIKNYDKETAFRATCAVTVSAGQLVGFNASGQLVLADADAPVEAVGFALEDAAAGQVIGVGTQGRLEDPTWTWTPGGKVWLSATAGALVATRPSATNAVIQPVGRAIAATKLIVNVTPAVAQVQASGSTTVAFI